MGTWEAPKEVIDQSLGGLIAGFGQMTAGAVAGLQQRNQAKREAAKQKGKNNNSMKQFKEIEAIRTEYGDIGSIPDNLIDEKFQNYVTEQLEGLYTLDYDTPAYIKAVERVKLNVSMTSQSIGIINEENKQFKKMYMPGNNEGERKLLSFDQEGAALIKSDYIPYYKMQYDWKYNHGKNIEFKKDKKGIGYLEYTNPDDVDNPLQISFAKLPTMFPEGEGYFGSVSTKSTDAKMKSFWNNKGKAFYNQFGPSTKLDANTRDGAVIEETIRSYEEADAKFIENFRKRKQFDRAWAGGITQNDWQVMGFTSEYKGTKQQQEDFRDEVIERTANSHFKRDDIKSSHKEIVQGQVANRVNNYQTQGFPGFPANFIVPEDMGNTEGGEPFGSADATYTLGDIEVLAKNFGERDEVKKLAEMLSRMSSAGKGKQEVYMTGQDMARDIVKKTKLRFKNNGWPENLPEDSTNDDILKYLSTEEDAETGETGPFYNINPLLWGPNSVSDLYSKSGDYGYPQFRRLRDPNGGTDVAMVRDLILQETGMSPSELNAVKSIKVGSTTGRKNVQVSTIDREKFKAKEGDDIDRINDRNVSGAQALDMIREGFEEPTPGPTNI